MCPYCINCNHVISDKSWRRHIRLRCKRKTFPKIFLKEIGWTQKMRENIEQVITTQNINDILTKQKIDTNFNVLGEVKNNE